MCKKINKSTAMLLSGIMMSSVAVSLAETNSFANENTTALEQSVNNRSAVRTGVVTATALHVRSKADASSASLGGLSKGDKVEIVDTASNGWYKIKYKTGYGYVSNKYVDVISTNTSSEYTSNKTTITHTGITTDGLNVRSGASTSYSKISITRSYCIFIFYLLDKIFIFVIKHKICTYRFIKIFCINTKYIITTFFTSYIIC